MMCAHEPHPNIHRLTDLCRVVCGAKDELGGTIVARANVGHVGLVGNEDFGATEIAKLEHSRCRI